MFPPHPPAWLPQHYVCHWPFIHLGGEHIAIYLAMSQTQTVWSQDDWVHLLIITMRPLYLLYISSYTYQTTPHEKCGSVAMQCMGYWPSVRSRWLDIGQVLFLRVYGLRRSRGPYKHAKKERGEYPAILTEQAWSIKDLLYGIKHQNMINFPCGTKPASRADKIAPSCPLG